MHTICMSVGSIPLRLLDCFLLVTPLLWDAFGSSFVVDCDGDVVFWTIAWIS